jgi:hypothetical protein
MSDGLDVFQERIRKLIQDNRLLAGQAKKPFDPQATLQKLLQKGAPKIPSVKMGKLTNE